MKTWPSFGSEHSAKLKIVAEFDDTGTADETLRILNQIQAFSMEHQPVENSHMSTFYKQFRDTTFGLVSSDLEGLCCPHNWEQTGTAIEVYTDDTEIQGIIKVFIGKGAKIRLHSRHDHPGD
ncbi:MAG: DUF6375 family protein [Phycisphaerales bacterium JB040]